jgi:23S rRNA pseudouridine2605 synthase
MAEELIRLNKFISHNSRFSRREADKLIEDGKVVIDGKVITDLATKVDEHTIVKVNDRTVKVDKKRAPTVIVYNKQKGEIVSKKDPQGRTVVFDTIPKKFAHFIPIGRLDYASEGVLLLTDDVNIANSLMHSNLERVYKIKIAGKITEQMIYGMENGLILDDATAGAYDKTSIKNMEFAPFNGYMIQKDTDKFSILKVSISEGKNRELRRFFGHFDATVLDLKRVSFGGIDLNNLPTNKTRYFSRREYDDLHKYLKEVRRVEDEVKHTAKNQEKQFKEHQNKKR